MTDTRIRMSLQWQAEEAKTVQFETAQEGMELVAALSKYALAKLETNGRLAKVALSLQVELLDQLSSPDASFPQTFVVDDATREVHWGGLTEQGDSTDLQSIALLGAMREHMPDLQIEHVRANNTH